MPRVKTIEEKITNALTRHPQYTDRTILTDYARGADLNDVVKMRAKLEAEGVIKPREYYTSTKTSTPSVKHKGGLQALSLDDLRSRHNPHYKISRELQNVGSGAIYEESDFKTHMQSNGVTPSQYNQVMRSSEFAVYKGKSSSGSVYYIGDPKKIKTLKDEGTLL